MIHAVLDSERLQVDLCQPEELPLSSSDEADLDVEKGGATEIPYVLARAFEYGSDRLVWKK